MKFIKVMTKQYDTLYINPTRVDYFGENKTGKFFSIIGDDECRWLAGSTDLETLASEIERELVKKSSDEPTPNKVKLRPMSEAPRNIDIVVYKNVGEPFLGILGNEDCNDGNPCPHFWLKTERGYLGDIMFADEFIGWTELQEVGDEPDNR